MEVKLSRKQVKNRVKWVRALLSGDYQQGSGALKSKLDSEPGKFFYCCLGVACEVLNSGSTDIIIPLESHSSSGYIDELDANKLLGLTYEFDQRSAGTWNDNDGFGFARIADLVAHATEQKIKFNQVDPNSVPEGYAVQWLEGK